MAARSRAWPAHRDAQLAAARGVASYEDLDLATLLLTDADPERLEPRVARIVAVLDEHPPLREALVAYFAHDLDVPASATELAQFLRDPAQREQMLQTAAKANYPAANYKIATNLLIAVQRGQTTENVSKIRELLKIAGRAIPRAKLDLANCMAVGCDGHPADALTARAFGIDAARDGEPTAFISMVRMPWGQRIPRSQLLAWQLFGDRLNESGCMGDQYIPTSLAFGQTIGMLTSVLDNEDLEETKRQLDALWAEHGTRAMKENGCE